MEKIIEYLKEEKKRLQHNVHQLDVAIDILNDLNIENKVQPKYKIGDELYGGTVVYVDESGKHGLVVSNKDLGYADWHKAQKLCKDFSDGNWRLPIKNELQLCYLAHQKGVGGFVANFYWSSSEYSATSAWGQSFTNGTQANGLKYDYNYVRAVRSF